MNVDIARKRISQVFMVDSINSSESDFMATHIPFRNITFRHGVKDIGIEHISDEDVFTKLFMDPSSKNNHQFVIVEGSSGSGKSHFIRWLYANLKANYSDNDEILLIRRSDNTLKGTIKQLLGIEAIKNLKNKDVYERLVKANTSISEKKFKDDIFYKFIVEINDSDNETFSSIEKKRLVALLNYGPFKEQMMQVNGPIERIFSKIVATSTGNKDVVAQFENKDFLITLDFFDELRNTADKQAVGIAKKLVDDENLDDEFIDRLSAFMNGLVDDVIQSCAGIEPGDFEQIFKEIRQELAANNKNLILLIEDITSFTGINQALLNVLVTEHTGENSKDNMCKLISVVGTTSEYYKQFRSNYKDRITTQITIEDGTIGQVPNDLYMFFAKYLNAISVSEEEINDWYYNHGANENELPIGVNNVADWEYISIGDLKLSLYPFTKNSINNLYSAMDEHKTPRYILREIIEPAVNELLNSPDMFLYYLRKKDRPLSENVESRINNIVDSLQISDEDKPVYRNRALAFLGFWGNGKLEKNANSISGIKNSIFKNFNFELLYEKLAENVNVESKIGDDDVETPVPFVNVKPKEKEDKEYTDYKKILDSWYNEKKVFASPRYLLEELNKIISSSINWQQYGIPVSRIKMIMSASSSSFRLLSFERQDKGEDLSALKLMASPETYDLFRVVGQWIYLGKRSWNFKGADTAIFIVTRWIENHKNELIKAVKKIDKQYIPQYIRVAISNEIIRMLLAGQMNGSKLENISVESFVKVYSKNRIDTTHCKKWNDLNNICNDPIGENNYQAVIDYFNISQGESFKKVLLNYVDFDKAIKEARKDVFHDFSNLEKTPIKEENSIYDFNNELRKRIPQLLEEEDQNNKQLISNIYSFFGWDSSIEIEVADLKEFIANVDEFYSKCEKEGAFIQKPNFDLNELKSKSADICKKLSNIKETLTFDESQKLISYSKIDYSDIYSLIGLFNKVNYDVNYILPIMENEYEKLTRSGVYIDVDPRFDSYNNAFDSCMKELEENNGNE